MFSGIRFHLFLHEKIVFFCFRLAFFCMNSLCTNLYGCVSTILSLDDFSCGVVSIFDVTVRLCHILLNSLTAKSVPTGTKNSCLEGFWLAKHKDTNIPTMMEPFSPLAAWFCWPSVPHPWVPLRKRLVKAAVEGF